MFKPMWMYATFSLLVFVCAGCVPGLEGNLPRAANKALPESFSATSMPEGMPANNAGMKNWNEFFDSPVLQALIGTALRNNQELNMRLQEIIIAKNEISARRGELWPKVSGGVGAGVDKIGAKTSQGVSDKANDLPEILGNFGFGLSATWEIDVWSKMRDAVKSANLKYLASIEARNFIITQLVAEIARSYYELMALDNQIEVLNRNIKIQTDALEVVRLEKLSARVTELAVQRFEAEVLKNRSRLFDLEQERVQAENRINFLLGRFPCHVERNGEELMAPLPAIVQTGIPSQLLANRPDVRAAELDLEASKLDVNVAKAAFYPSLSIDTSVGYRSFNVAHLLTTPESVVFGFAGNLMAPLLNRAGISAQYLSANARQLQAVFNYERTLLQAFTDVANQLVKLENLKKGYELQSQQVDVLNQAVETSNVLFRSARADYMEVLLTRRDSLDAQMEVIETKKRLLQSMVNIYQALGGGWRP